MFKALKSRLQRLRNGLTRLDDRPISEAVLVIVIFLDLFILSTLFQGLEEHTSQLLSPGEQIPRQCRDAIIEGSWTRDNRLTRIAALTSRNYNRYSYRERETPIGELQPACQGLIGQIRAIEGNSALSAQLDQYLKLRTQSGQVRSEMERSRLAHDTGLLESIAGREATKTDAVENANKSARQRLDELLNQESALAGSLEADPLIKALFQRIEQITPEQRQQLLEELRNANFWFPVRRLGMEMLFLLPLILVFGWWNSSSLRRRKPYQTLVSTHLLVVVFIPVLFKLIELVSEIIPHKLLKQLIEFLQSLKLVAIWHYAAMALGIGATLGIIYLVQHKLFSRERLLQRRIIRGQCQGCGEKLPAGANACPLCGYRQFRPCTECHQPTFVHGRYCRECGAEQTVTQ